MPEAQLALTFPARGWVSLLTNKGAFLVCPLWSSLSYVKQTQGKRKLPWGPRALPERRRRDTRDIAIVILRLSLNVETPRLSREPAALMEHSGVLPWGRIE